MPEEGKPLPVRVAHSKLRVLLAEQMPLSAEYEEFRRLTVQLARTELSKALIGGALGDSTRSAFAAFKASLVERSVDPEHGLTKELVTDYLDRHFEIRAVRLRGEEVTREALEIAASRALSEGLDRVGLALTGSKGAIFQPAPGNKAADTFGPGIGEAPIIEVLDDLPPIEFDDDSLGEDGFKWMLTETLTRIRCVEETPGEGSDDIIFQGQYAYRGETSKLKIDPVEIDFDAGTSHFYDRDHQQHGHSPPHARVELVPSEAALLYLSTHLLTESDGWTEIAAAVAELLKEVVQNPIQTAAGAAAGAIPGLSQIPGADAGASLVGSAVDSALDSLTNDALTRLGRDVHDAVYQAIAAIWDGDNIAFETWYTAVWIRWNNRMPRWSVRHGVGGRFSLGGTFVKPGHRNEDGVEISPIDGEGWLHASIYRQDGRYLEPAVWDADEYEEMTGKYLYESTIRVIRRPFHNPVDPIPKPV